MPDAAQFTLNLFDSTALGSTMEAPKTWEPSEASAEPELAAELRRLLQLAWSRS